MLFLFNIHTHSYSDREQFGVRILQKAAQPKIFGMHTGADRDRNTNLPVSRWPWVNISSMIFLFHWDHRHYDTDFC